jgi:hypothetical protein
LVDVIQDSRGYRGSWGIPPPEKPLALTPPRFKFFEYKDQPWDPKIQVFIYDEIRYPIARHFELYERQTQRQMRGRITQNKHIIIKANPIYFEYVPQTFSETWQLKESFN